MRSIHTFQPRKSGAAEAGIFEPSDGPTLTKQCLTVVDMGRHAAEVHLFGKNIQQKSSKPEGHAVNQHIFEKNEDWYAEHSSSLYQVYRVTICYLPPIQGSRKFHWHTYFIFGQGQVLERDEKASGQHQLRKPQWPTGGNSQANTPKAGDSIGATPVVWSPQPGVEGVSSVILRHHQLIQVRCRTCNQKIEWTKELSCEWIQGQHNFIWVFPKIMVYKNHPF